MSIYLLRDNPHYRAGTTCTVSAFSRTVQPTLPCRYHMYCFCIQSYCPAHTTVPVPHVLYLHSVELSSPHYRAGTSCSVSAFSRTVQPTLPCRYHMFCICIQSYCPSHTTVPVPHVLYLHSVKLSRCPVLSRPSTFHATNISMDTHFVLSCIFFMICLEDMVFHKYQQTICCSLSRKNVSGNC